MTIQKKRKPFVTKLINVLLWLNGSRKIYDSVKLSNWFIDSLGVINSLPFRVPRLLTKDWEQQKIADTVCFIKPGNENRTIFFLHGGGYTQRPTIFHFMMMDAIHAKTGANIVFPLYPLAPNHTFDAAYRRLTVIYRETKLLANDHDFTLMGDSAGGGLALGFYLHLHEIKERLPNKLIIIAPWLDLTLKNPLVPKLDADDKMLGHIGLREMGKRWAGNADIDQYRLSPINGDLTLVDRLLLIAGTNDILFPDCQLLADKLRDLGKDCEFVIGEGLPHDFPLMPTPEAAKAIKKIISYILEKSN